MANGNCVQWLTKGGSSLPPPLPGLNRGPERGWHGVTFPPQSCAHDVWAAQSNQFLNPQWGRRDTEEIIRNQPRIEMCSCVYTHSFNKKFTLPFTIWHHFGLCCLLWALQARVCFPHVWCSRKKFTSSFLLYPVDSSARFFLLTVFRSPSILRMAAGRDCCVCCASRRVAQLYSILHFSVLHAASGSAEWKMPWPV